MFYLITGGSGSGKSEYAEEVICKLWEQENSGKLFYIATMVPEGAETGAKIERHRQMRDGKGFQTLECYTDLAGAAAKITEDNPESSVLLECISNLAANEMYREEGAGPAAAEKIMTGIKVLQKGCLHVVVVTNEVCSEGPANTAEMRHYKEVLGRLNGRMGETADRMIEVVYGIPVEVKG